ncbi:hypothetical protein EI427_21565 [Flammeovirga pectinis]|uniref:Uncharacterized protein n=1 Tax=Flammeovirga pectinis TaxID=2494373 RepID=A0A3S9P9E3_9BACT|nr:hypothetical protein [Flammeovirga pectinis]AZQ64816.1 hypothetical protein EI427_21565 [Flammeovirga pectinis]
MKNKIAILWFIIGFPSFIVFNIYHNYDLKNEDRQYSLINYYSTFKYEVKECYQYRGSYNIITTTNDSIYFLFQEDNDYVKIIPKDSLIKNANSNKITILSHGKEYIRELTYYPRNSYLHELKNEEEHLNKYGEVEKER